MLRSALVVAAAALVAAATPLAAQMSTLPASSTKGFFLGAHLNGSSLTLEEEGEEETESGGGLGLQLGYGFTPRLALVLEGTGASLDVDEEEPLGFGHFDVMLRYAFTSPVRRFVPFIEGGFSGRALTQEVDGEDVTLSGSGLTIGAGAQYYFAPKWAVGAGLKFTTGEFDTVKVDNVSVDGLDLDATSTRFNLGITWYPMAGR